MRLTAYIIGFVIICGPFSVLRALNVNVKTRIEVKSHNEGGSRVGVKGSSSPGIQESRQQKAGKCKGGSATYDCCQANGYECLEGEGDCDNNDECAASLVCGHDNCGAGFPSKKYDCCEKQTGETCTAGSTYEDCCRGKKCAEGEGDCDEDSECAEGLVCGTSNCGAGFPSHYDCCEKKGETCKAGSTSEDCCRGKKCAEGEGDCDEDSECAEGLVCGTNNCGEGFPSHYDCCEEEDLDH